MWYFIGWSLCFAYTRFNLSVKVYGRHNVPAKGAFVFAANHASFLDPVLLGTSIFRSLNYMAREDLFDKGFLAWALPKVQTFPVRRGESDVVALRQAIRLLRNGRPLVIFPEGTRSGDGRLKPGKPGVGMVVAKTGVPVVPAYIEGSFDALPRTGGTIRRRQVRVFIGKPVAFSRDEGRAFGRDAYQRISDAIMAEITVLRQGCEQGNSAQFRYARQESAA